MAITSPIPSSHATRASALPLPLEPAVDVAVADKVCRGFMLSDDARIRVDTANCRMSLGSGDAPAKGIVRFVDCRKM